MVERISSHIQQYNYNTINSVKNIRLHSKNDEQIQNAPSFTAASTVPLSNQTQNINLRTTLSSKEEKNKYTAILTKLDKNGKKIVDSLLKNGVLLNANSNDKSTVLDNLYKIVKEPRAEGLDSDTILRDTIAAISYPYIITQQFGDIPIEYRQKVIQANRESQTNLLDIYQSSNEIDVEHSGTCVAASTEFKLAKQMPAEFARFAQELSSPKMSVEKL